MVAFRRGSHPPREIGLAPAQLDRVHQHWCQRRCRNRCCAVPHSVPPQDCAACCSGGCRCCPQHRCRRRGTHGPWGRGPRPWRRRHRPQRRRPSSSSAAPAGRPAKAATRAAPRRRARAATPAATSASSSATAAVSPPRRGSWAPWALEPWASAAGPRTVPAARRKPGARRRAPRWPPAARRPGTGAVRCSRPPGAPPGRRARRPTAERRRAPSAVSGSPPSPWSTAASTHARP
mmetsp:Transcript_148837/g.478104  ORF Transcript_148837/g.478104 Transcript_148837/m.478104 type:complete len:234 (+) Transcript_148837:217-918(+)